MSWLFVRRLRSFVLLAAAASFVLNVVLLMLALITLLFLVLGSFVDTVRSRALAWAGRSLDRKLAPTAIRSSLLEAAAGTGRVDTDALRDIAQLRTFLSGSGVLALFDAPWATLYLDRAHLLDALTNIAV